MKPFDEQLLTAYLDNELSEEDRAMVLSHVEADPRLSKLLRELQLVRQIVSSLPCEMLETDLTTRVLGRAEWQLIHGEDEEEVAGSHRPESRDGIEFHESVFASQTARSASTTSDEATSEHFVSASKAKAIPTAASHVQNAGRRTLWGVIATIAAMIVVVVGMSPWIVSRRPVVGTNELTDDTLDESKTSESLSTLASSNLGLTSDLKREDDGITDNDLAKQLSQRDSDSRNEPSLSNLGLRVQDVLMESETIEIRVKGLATTGDELALKQNQVAGDAGAIGGNAGLDGAGAAAGGFAGVGQAGAAPSGNTSGAFGGGGGRGGLGGAIAGPGIGGAAGRGGGGRGGRGAGGRAARSDSIPAGGAGIAGGDSLAGGAKAPASSPVAEGMERATRGTIASEPNPLGGIQTLSAASSPSPTRAVPSEPNDLKFAENQDRFFRLRGGIDSLSDSPTAPKTDSEPQVRLEAKDGNDLFGANLSQESTGALYFAYTVPNTFMRGIVAEDRNESWERLMDGNPNKEGIPRYDGSTMSYETEQSMKPTLLVDLGLVQVAPSESRGGSPNIGQQSGRKVEQLFVPEAAWESIRSRMEAQGIRLSKATEPKPKSADKAESVNRPPRLDNPLRLNEVRWVRVNISSPVQP